MQVNYIDFEDGHRPGNTTTKQKLAVNLNKQSKEFFSVYDNLLSKEWCNRAYEYALSRNSKPFGIYIQTTDAQDVSLNPEELWEKGDHQRALALVVTRAFIFERGVPLLQKDIERIHGTAVWCLSSGISNAVEYHIDYAELYRYETNIIHPPLYAGTCHVSPIGTGEMDGGSFCANMRGLDHYKQFGYKCRLAQEESESESGSGSTLLEKDMELDSAWQTVRYRENRGILHDGDLAHLSTPIKSIVPGKRRVIFGLNCFSEEMAECCIRAPEHSDAFNRTVKLYQWQAGAKIETKYGVSLSGGSTGTDGDDNKSTSAGTGKISAKEVLKKPALARLLVMAAKKVKEHKDTTGEDFMSKMPEHLKTAASGQK